LIAAHAAPARVTASSDPKPGANPQAQRKLDAQQRQQLAARLKPVKRALEQTEQRMTALTGEKAALEATAQKLAKKRRLMTFAARGAEFLSKRVTLLLWVARFNLVGLVLTVGEIAYYIWVAEDDLEKWCAKSIFRDETAKGVQEQKEPPFSNANQELSELARALRGVTGL
jgi:hypothetical protein